ncbi:vWA domain-containing protein [Larsenimonas suaedae]|uniref:VWA-like domain-containing protein n=1 Tax=Larsenimonas suaedae TaxID=1851019 RepID=A0ABU1H0V7_9GAMM|nr:VWA-like domain-containing protein [Larsenimonas suaedae]MCM2973758.1 VWA-like domain-containing protein [Larsenimonas suaedae]MDR5897282.1 VWA-like domain-containing protein [Larsenimonas suaedae]
MNAPIHPNLATAQKALDKAKIALMRQKDSAFFCTVCFSLKHVWDTRVETAETDGLTIYYSPDFFLAHTPEQQLGLLLHETLHVAFMHMVRRGTREPEKFNRAADYVINLIITDRGIQIPPGGLLDRQYQGMSTEEVYDLLPDEPTEPLPMSDLIEPGQGDAPPGDSPGESGGRGVPGSGANEAAAEVEQKIQDILVRAALQSKMMGDTPGSIPGQIQIFIDTLLNPKLPWHQILARFMNAMVKEDYSWRRPNRRFMPEHYLPSLYSEGLGEVAIAVDASASVKDAEFLRFVSETHGILSRMKPPAIHLIQFDTCIKSVNRVRTTRELENVEFKGRGGTHIGEVMDWTARHKPQVLLMFTDGHFRFDENVIDPRVQIIWLIHDNTKFNAPFGKTIHYAMDD